MKLNLDDKDVKEALGTNFWNYAALAKISITPEDYAIFYLNLRRIYWSIDTITLNNG